MKSLHIIFCILCLSAMPLSGQIFFDSLEVVSTDNPWLSPAISDEMTKDPEQNRLWRLGQYKYSAKPKHMWELGIHGGNFLIDGDVDHKLVPGLGLGLHLRRSLTYFTSIRFDAFAGRTKGLEPQPWKHRNWGGGLVDQNATFNGWEAYDTERPEDSGWFPSYQTNYYYGAVQFIFNIGNILFHQERNKWNTYIGLGVGAMHHDTRLDLRDANGGAYLGLIERTTQGIGNPNLPAGRFDFDLFNTRAGRQEILNRLELIYDGTYETEGFQQAGVFRLGDDINIHGVFTASFGVSRKLSRRFNISLEHQAMFADNDYLDGVKFRSSVDQSNNNDVAHYTNLRLGMNLGNFNKRIEPLYWQNPNNYIVSDIAELKARPQFEYTDNDNDGVLDLIDQELDTPEGCLVDTKGVTMDSDGDGVVDCKDKEPFSPPGYPVDEFGVAQVPSDSLNLVTEQDVITIISNNCDACRNTGIGYAPGTYGQNGTSGINGQSGVNGQNGPTGANGQNGTSGVNGQNGTSGVNGQNGTAGVNGTSGVNGTNGRPGTNGSIGTVIHSGCGNWFLPMIHFDLDKYALRPEAYVSIHQVASVMRKCPTLCVTAQGHTDVRSSNSYNDVLSYKRANEAINHMVAAYGIDRSRFKLMYGGEENPLIANLKSNHYTSDVEEQMQFINRRVEFRVCEDTDLNMGRPDGPDAGVKSYGSSRPGSKYKGYKTSGY